MSSTGSVHLPENLVLGAVLTSLSCLGAAVMSALVKAAETLTSAVDIVLFQNLIGFLLVLPSALRGGWAVAENGEGGHRASRQWHCRVVRPVRGNNDDAVDKCRLVDVQHSAADARNRMGVPPRESIQRDVDRRCRRLCRGDPWSFSPSTRSSTSAHSYRWQVHSASPSLGSRSARLGKTEPTSRILFYYFGISTVLCLPVAVLDWRPFGLRASVYLVGIAAILLISLALIVLAFRYAPPVKAGPFIYTVVVFTALIDW